ncbi:PadR family transcriptional regulator, partial [Lactobacillus sp. CRM56-2]|nr:PadR family transcriptional regulator [Lactobacillus sp. CRM56-2]
TAQHKREKTNTHMLAADIQDALMVNELQRVRAQAQLDRLDRQ